MKRLFFGVATAVVIIGGAATAAIALAAPSETNTPAVQQVAPAPAPEPVEVKTGITGTMTGPEGCTVAYTVTDSIMTIDKVGCGFGGSLEEQAHAALGEFYEEMVATATQPSQ